MAITINGTTGITTPEVILDNTAADGGQVVLKSSGYSNWNLDNYSGRFRGYYGSTEYFTVNASGNMGIGTSSPQSKLHINGASSSPPTSGTAPTGVFEMTTDGAGYSLFGGGYNSGSFATWLQCQNKNDLSDFGPLALQPAGGNLLVGTTSGLGGDGQRVAIKSTDTTGLRVYRATATTSNAIQIWQSDVGGTAAEKYFVLANGTATSSDQRLKENIEDVNGCLDKLLQVRVRNFTWKEQDGNEKDIGVIAQEIEQVLPEMVWENPHVAEGSVAYKAVRYDKLTPMLVKAIQEQQALITQQAAALTQLQADVAALKGQQA